MGVFAGASGELDAIGGATVQTAKLNVGGSAALGAGGAGRIVASTGGTVSATSLVRLFTGTIDATGGGSVDIGTGITAIAGTVHIGSSGSLLQLQGISTINGQVVVDPSPGSPGPDIEVNGGNLVINGDITGSGGIQIDAGSTLELHINDLDSFSGTLTGGGSLIVDGGGTLGLTGGNAFTGNVTVGNGTTLELATGTAAGSGSIIFDPTGTKETLQVDGTTMPTNVISGFAPSDTIDLKNVTYDANGSAILQSFGGVSQKNVLTMVENGKIYFLQLDPSADFSGKQFKLSADKSGQGTDITVTPGLDFNLSFDQTKEQLSSGNGQTFLKAVDQAAYFFF
jgi:hypothetical protein